MSKVDDKLRSLGDIKNQNEFEFEEFKNNFMLK
jgi:hypothetical protein